MRHLAVLEFIIFEVSAICEMQFIKLVDFKSRYECSKVYLSIAISVKMGEKLVMIPIGLDLDLAENICSLRTSKPRLTKGAFCAQCCAQYIEQS